MWKSEASCKILHNAHAQKYVNLELNRLKIANFPTECARAINIRGAGVGLGTKLMLLHNNNMYPCCKVGGLSPLTMKSEGAPLPPLYLRPCFCTNKLPRYTDRIR